MALTEVVDNQHYSFADYAQWQPIKSAPTNRRILLYYPDLVQVTGRYDLEKKCLIADMPFPTCYQPTHWMDLPDNPD